MTDLSVDCAAIRAPEGNEQKDRIMRKLSGSIRVPALRDTRRGTLLQDYRKIVAHLDRSYSWVLTRTPLVRPGTRAWFSGTVRKSAIGAGLCSPWR